MPTPSTPHLLAIEIDAQAWAPTVAAGIALLSLVVAFVGTRLSNKKSGRALALSEAQGERRVARLNCEVEKTGHWIESGGTKLHWVGAYVFLENPTDRDGTISRAELTVNYTRNDQPIVMRILHKKPIKATKDILSIPLRLPANSADRGWVTFPIYPDSIDYRDVVGLSIEFSDTRDVAISVPIWPAKEYSYDPTR